MIATTLAAYRNAKASQTGRLARATAFAGVTAMSFLASAPAVRAQSSLDGNWIGGPQEVTNNSGYFCNVTSGPIGATLHVRNGTASLTWYDLRKNRYDVQATLINGVGSGVIQEKEITFNIDLPRNVVNVIFGHDAGYGIKCSTRYSVTKRAPSASNLPSPR